MPKWWRSGFVPALKRRCLLLLCPGRTPFFSKWTYVSLKVTSFFPTLVLCKIPAYFGNWNKIRRATQSSPFQREEFPKKSKVVLLYFLSARLSRKWHSPVWKFSTVPTVELVLRHLGELWGTRVSRDALQAHDHLERTKKRNWQKAGGRQSGNPVLSKKRYFSNTNYEQGDSLYFKEYPGETLRQRGQTVSLFLWCKSSLI